MERGAALKPRAAAPDRRWRRWSAVLGPGLGLVAPGEFLSHFTVFMLAIFVGFQVVWNVKPALHTRR